MKKLSVILFNLVLPVWAKALLSVIGNAIDKATNPIREELKKLSSEFETFKQEFMQSVLQKIEDLTGRISTLESAQKEFKTWVLSQLAGLSGNFVAIDINEAGYNGAEIAAVIEKEEGSLKANTKYRVTNIGNEPLRLSCKVNPELPALTNGEFVSIKTDENGEIVSAKHGNSIEDEQRDLAIKSANDATVQYADNTFVINDNLGDYGAETCNKICADWLKERA
jgi:hypothetical protein